MSTQSHNRGVALLELSLVLPLLLLITAAVLEGGNILRCHFAGVHAARVAAVMAAKVRVISGSKTTTWTPQQPQRQTTTAEQELKRCFRETQDGECGHLLIQWRALRALDSLAPARAQRVRINTQFNGDSREIQIDLTMEYRPLLLPVAMFNIAVARTALYLDPARPL